MRAFGNINYARVKDPVIRAVLKHLVDVTREHHGALAKAVFSGQNPAANPVPGGTSSTPTPPGQGLPSPVQGDTLYGLLVGTWAKRSIGAAGTVYSSNGSEPTWASLAGLLPVHDHSGVGQGGNIPESSVTNLVADLAARELLANKNAASGYAGLDGSTKLSGAQQKYGSAANTACEGNDARLSDDRTPLTHGASKHTDRTRTIFIPWQLWTETTGTGPPISEAVGTFPDRYSGVPMTGIAGTTRLLAEIVLPQDFTTGTASWGILYASAGVSTNQVHFDLSYKAVAPNGTLTAAADTTMSGNTSPTGTVDQLSAFAIGSTVTALSAGAFVRLTLQRDAGHASDTNTDDVDFIGLQLDYTADM